MGDHIIWKLRFESSGRNAGFPGKVGLGISKDHLKNGAYQVYDTVLSAPRTVGTLSGHHRRPPRIFRESLRFLSGGGVLFILQEC